MYVSNCDVSNCDVSNLHVSLLKIKIQIIYQFATIPNAHTLKQHIDVPM